MAPVQCSVWLVRIATAVLLTILLGIGNVLNQLRVVPAVCDQIFRQTIVEIIVGVWPVLKLRFIRYFIHRRKLSQPVEVILNRRLGSGREARLRAELFLDEVDQHLESVIPIDVSIVLCFPPKLLDRAQNFCLHEWGLAGLGDERLPDPPSNVVVSASQVDLAREIHGALGLRTNYDSVALLSKWHRPSIPLLMYFAVEVRGCQEFIHIIDILYYCAGA